MLRETGGMLDVDAELLFFLLLFAAVFLKPCQVVVDFGDQLTRASRDVVMGAGNFDIHRGYPAEFEGVIKLLGFGYRRSQIFHTYHDHGRSLDIADQ